MTNNYVSCFASLEFFFHRRAEKLFGSVQTIV